MKNKKFCTVQNLFFKKHRGVIKAVINKNFNIAILKKN
jgi:hypothetical protein